MDRALIIPIEDGFIDETTYKEIEKFLTPKKRNLVFMTVAGQTQISQGELAEEINATPTATSNLLSKFTSFEHKLLESKNVGKFKFYFLTPLGRAYYAASSRPKQHGMVVKGETGEKLLYQKAKSSLEGFMQQCADDWQTEFAVCMGSLVNGRRLQEEEKGEKLREFLWCIERLTMCGAHDEINKVMQLLEESSMRGLVVRFMERFDPFKAVLTVLERDSDPRCAYRLVEAAFSKETLKEFRSYIEQAEWKHGEFDVLEAEAKKICRELKGYDRDEIYDYLDYLLPGQRQLCLYIALYIGVAD